MGVLDVPKRKCSARSKRTGTPCGNAPVAGAAVCRMHGGAAPQVLAAARVRLRMAAEKAVKTIEEIMADDSVSASDRLKAAQMVLDRAGLPAKAEVEVEVTLKPWEKILEDGIAFDGADGEVVARAYDYSAREVDDVVPGEVVRLDPDHDPNSEE